MGNEFIEAILKGEDNFPERDFGWQEIDNFDNPGELNKIADAYCLIGLFEKACALYRRIIELNPDWIDILDVYARALWALHNYEDARRLWGFFLDRKKSVYAKIGIPLNFFTVDDVFTSAFGNFTHFFPMDKCGYLSDEDEFYYHKTDRSEGRRSLVPTYGKVVCNEALYRHVFVNIHNDIPKDILLLLREDDYVTRLPFYCGTDMNRRLTHFHSAFADKMLHLCNVGAAARIHFESEQIDDCEQRLARMGVKLDRPIICIHARESGYWGRTGDLTHSTKNADILSYVPAIQFLTDNGFQVVRLGDPSMKPLPPLKSVFDYAISEHRNDYLDLYLIAHSEFVLCTSSGPFTVASMFNVPVLATNWVTAHLLPFLPRDLVMLKTFRYRDNKHLLSFREMLDLDYGEFSYYNFRRKNIEVVDNTPAELLRGTREMVESLHAEPAADLVDYKLARPPKSESSIASKFDGGAIVSKARFVRDSIW